MQSLKPAYAEAATALKAHDPTILIAKVDATEEKDIAGQFDVKGYPTIKWFVDGEYAMDFGGGRSASEIVNWVKKKSGPPSVEIKSAADVKTAKKEEVAVIGYFKEFSGKDHDDFESTASKTDDAAFFKTTDEKLASSLGLSKHGFALLRNHEGFDPVTISAEDHDSFKSGSTEEKLTAFILAEKLPLFLAFNNANSGKIFNSGISNQIIVVAPSDTLKADASLRKDIEASAAKTRGKVVWVTSPADDESAAPIINFFGLDKDAKDPQVVGFQSEGGKKFSFPDEEKISVDALVKFAEAVVDGTAPRKTKSAAVPKEPTDEGVTVVVGSTFESIVKDPKKDVLLEVYAPWCGHCKALAPTYVKLAKRFEGVDSVVIAKMDGTENEHPELEVQGFPTILFFPAEENASAVTYSGGRELKDFTKFIKENAKVEYELPKKSDDAKEEEASDSHDEL